MDFVDLKAQYRRLKPAIDDRIQAVLDHGQYILGPEVRELEIRLAARIGAKHCIGCASGTDALLLAMMALGIAPGDEVIITENQQPIAKLVSEQAKPQPKQRPG